MSYKIFDSIPLSDVSPPNVFIEFYSKSFTQLKLNSNWFKLKQYKDNFYYLLETLFEIWLTILDDRTIWIFDLVDSNWQFFNFILQQIESIEIVEKNIFIGTIDGYVFEKC